MEFSDCDKVNMTDVFNLLQCTSEDKCIIFDWIKNMFALCPDLFSREADVSAKCVRLRFSAAVDLLQSEHRGIGVTRQHLDRDERSAHDRQQTSSPRR